MYPNDGWATNVKPLANCGEFIRWGGGSIVVSGSGGSEGSGGCVVVMKSVGVQSSGRDGVEVAV